MASTASSTRPQSTVSQSTVILGWSMRITLPPLEDYSHLDLIYPASIPSCIPAPSPLWPRREMVVFQVLPNELEVSRVLGNQDHSRFSAGCSKEKVVHQRLWYTHEIPAFLSRHGRKGRACLVPSRMTRRDYTSCSHQRSHQDFSDLFSLLSRLGSNQQFMKNDGAEIGARREAGEVSLHLRRTLPAPERSHIQVCVEYVFPHGSRSPSNTFSTPPLPATSRTPAINSSRKRRAERA